ncbi:hypothetical protein KY347_06545 [Candidatus Woesearchaeota archaeon]|nr:hypothetical protein [Candidatus Woesearchaeota archaeon]
MSNSPTAEYLKKSGVKRALGPSYYVKDHDLYVNNVHKKVLKKLKKGEYIPTKLFLDLFSAITWESYGKNPEGDSDFKRFRTGLEGVDCVELEEVNI